MGDHPRLVWPDVPSGLGMQSLMAILDHVKDMEAIFTDQEKLRCAVDDARTVELAVVSKIFPGLPDANDTVVIGATAADIECRAANAFGDAVEARVVIEDIMRACQPEGFQDTPLASLDWMALIMQFLPMIIDLIKKWLEGKK